MRSHFSNITTTTALLIDGRAEGGKVLRCRFASLLLAYQEGFLKRSFAISRSLGRSVVDIRVRRVGWGRRRRPRNKIKYAEKTTGSNWLTGNLTTMAKKTARMMMTETELRDEHPILTPPPSSVVVFIVSSFLYSSEAIHPGGNDSSSSKETISRRLSQCAAFVLFGHRSSILRSSWWWWLSWKCLLGLLYWFSIFNSNFQLNPNGTGHGELFGGRALSPLFVGRPLFTFVNCSGWMDTRSGTRRSSSSGGVSFNCIHIFNPLMVIYSERFPCCEPVLMKRCWNDKRTKKEEQFLFAKKKSLFSLPVDTGKIILA